MRYICQAIVFLAAGFVAACGAAKGMMRGPSDPDELRHRAALAVVIVENRTGRELRIGFRLSTPPGGAVVIGQVGAGAVATMAPIPAGEPLVLLAIGPEAERFELPPRSFDMDARWTWVIPADAPFVRTDAP
jgi:hypothetical protein